MRIQFVRACLVTTSILFAACDGGSKEAPGGASSGAASSAKPAASASASAKPAEAPPPAAVEMAEHDLASADASWKGWSASGPKDAQVMADGVKGARIAAKGPSLMDRKPGGDNGFDIAFEQAKADMKAAKTFNENAVKGGAGKVKVDYIKEDADLMEWTTTVGETKTYNFVLAMKVDGKDVNCKTNFMMGAGNEAEMKRDIDACKTLKHKK